MNAGMVVAGLMLIGILPRRRGRQRLAGLLLVLAVLGSLAGCGGGNAGGGKTTIQGTTPGAYTFTLNAAFSAGGVSQVQTTVNVTIQ